MSWTPGEVSSVSVRIGRRRLVRSASPTRGRDAAEAGARVFPREEFAEVRGVERPEVADLGAVGVDERQALAPRQANRPTLAGGQRVAPAGLGPAVGRDRVAGGRVLAERGGVVRRPVVHVVADHRRVLPRCGDASVGAARAQARFRLVGAAGFGDHGGGGPADDARDHRLLPRADQHRVLPRRRPGDEGLRGDRQRARLRRRRGPHRDRARRRHRRGDPRGRADARLDPRDPCARRPPVGGAVPARQARRADRDRRADHHGAAHLRRDLQRRARRSPATARSSTTCSRTASGS